MSSTSANHPCQSCGACCNTYRVSFHYSEMLEVSHGVPEAMSRQITPYQNAMIGTNQAEPSCIAFRGVVGQTSSCSIYENRPECCRLFKASFENGAHEISCDQARAGKGLKPLTLADWLFAHESPTQS